MGSVLSMASSSSSTVPSSSSTTVPSSSSTTVPSSEQTSHFSSQTETEMESSKARHWSQLGYPTTEMEMLAETNFHDFNLLKNDPRWSLFSTDFEALEVGEKISEGAQADIYEARMTPGGPYNLVVKVMKGDARLEAFQAQFPIGMWSARSKDKCVKSMSLHTILGGTVLRDLRLRGKFAFVMIRRWGDLRLLIDRRMEQQRSTRGPFPIDKAIYLMLTIAEHMISLSDNDIIHRDLKASNVLVWGEFGEDMSLIATSNRAECIQSLVADFEFSVGVLGTKLWRAPEILEQSQARVPCLEVQFTHASDVYSYAMTCYEIVTGCEPFDGRGGEDMISQILKGRRPKLPHDLPEFVRNMIIGCWHPDPLERPTFSSICEALKQKKSPNLVSVVIDNKFERGASIVKFEKWNNPQGMTLLEVMQKLMNAGFFVLKAFDSSSAKMIIQNFEVTDFRGRKLANNKSNIVNITEALCLPIKMECIKESLKTCFYENTTVQMHVIEVVAEGDADNLLGFLSGLLVAMNFQVHSAGGWDHKGQVKYVIYIVGAGMFTLLWKLQHNFQKFSKITIYKVAAEESLSQLNKRLQDLKSVDLTCPHHSSNIRLHLREESIEGSRSTTVIVCLKNQWQWSCLSEYLVGMNYKVVGASIEYPISSDFLMGKATKSKYIDVGTFLKMNQRI